MIRLLKKIVKHVLCVIGASAFFTHIVLHNYFPEDKLGGEVGESFVQGISACGTGHHLMSSRCFAVLFPITL